MRKYKVVSRGTGACSDDFVSLKQYLFVEENGEKYLLLKFFNACSDTVTGMRFTVIQRDAEGNRIGAVNAESESLDGKPGSDFVFGEKIAVDNLCENFSVQLRSVFFGKYFGKYSYRINGEERVAVYRDEKAEQAADLADFMKEAGEKGISVAARFLKGSVVVGVCSLLILAVLLFANLLHLQNFKETATGFRLSGVEYSFVDGNRADDSDVCVTGYYGKSGTVRIPEKIENHKVTEISLYAFGADSRAKHVIIAGDPVIAAAAFRGCTGLISVDFGNVREIGNSAFENCTRLQGISARNLTEIGSFAFSGSGISYIDISNSGETLTIGDLAFGYCDNLRDVNIDQFIDYSGNISLFGGSRNVYSLRLKNYNYKCDEYKQPRAASLIDLFGGGFVSLAEAVIDYTDSVPDWFCSSLSVRRVTFGYMSELVVGAGAFAECYELEEVNFPDAVEWVGDMAFSQTSLVSFDSSRVRYIGQSAFENSGLRQIVFTGNTELTEIGRSAFSGCHSLSRVELPSSVIEIGEYAFSRCSSLVSVEIPDGVVQIGFGAFENCSNLQSISLPFIGGSADRNRYLGYIFGSYYEQSWCVLPDSLGYVNVSSSVTDVPEYAFYGCGGLVEVSFGSELSSVGNFAFSGCSSLRSLPSIGTDATIGTQAFYDCGSLSEVILKGADLWIGFGAFGGCNGLEEITLPFVGGSAGGDNRYFGYIFGAEGRYSQSNYVPASLKTVILSNEQEIPEYAFYFCRYIRNVSFGGRLRLIGESAFYGCFSLREIVIPQTVLEIRDNAFGECYRLFEIYNDSALTLRAGDDGPAYYALNVYGRDDAQAEKASDGGYTFLSTKEGWYLVDYPETDRCVLPDGFFASDGYVASYSIPKCLFAADGMICSVTIPAAVASIGERAFSECYSLEGVAFDGCKLTVIEPQLFSYCYILKEIDIPETADRIEEQAFLSCGSLEKVVLRGVSYIGENAFFGCNNLIEIYNLGPLELEAGSTENGYAAYYALVVHTSPDEEPVREVTVNGRFVFKTSGEAWRLVGYLGNEKNVVLEAFECDGITISSYSVGNSAFAGQSSVVSLSITEAVTDIGANAFGGCTNLAEVVFAEDSPITRIGESAFAGCESLLRIELPKNTEYIETYAFSSCVKLAYAVLPESLKEIGYGAFYGCEALDRVYNLSSLDVRCGSPDNGYVAYYASEVSDSRPESRSVYAAAVCLSLAGGKAYSEAEGREIC